MGSDSIEVSIVVCFETSRYLCHPLWEKDVFDDSIVTGPISSRSSKA